MKRLLQSVTATFLYICATTVYAAPPTWDPVFGAELTDLTDCDDCDESVLLGFNFPFAGGTYDSISVNNNGGVELGNTEVYVNSYIDYDIWDAGQFDGEFTGAGAPRILPFNTDLDNGCCANNAAPTVYFKTDGNTATITWMDTGTNQEDGSDDTPFATFQLMMASNGTITFGYDGIGVGKDMITALDQGIVVGVSDGMTAVPAGSMDLSAAGDSGVDPSVYEIWCYDVSPNVDCFEPNQQDNLAFDLDQSNLVFTPNGNGGFTVAASGTPGIKASGDGDLFGCRLGSDKVNDPTLLLLAMFSIIYLVRRRQGRIS